MNSSVHYLPATGRLLIAAIFIVSGFGKIAAPGMTQGYIASAGLPAPTIAYLIAVGLKYAVDSSFSSAFTRGRRPRC